MQPPRAEIGGLRLAETAGGMDGVGEQRWYVVRTKPRAEALAAENLRRRAIEVFFPRIAPLPVGSAVGQRSDEPLFPGYVFARLRVPEQFHLASWAPGVGSLLGNEIGSPTPIEDGVVESLRARADGGELLRPRPLQRGERVEIGRGPFAGLLGLVERPLSGPGRVRVLLDLLRRQTRVELDASFLLRRSA